MSGARLQVMLWCRCTLPMYEVTHGKRSTVTRPKAAVIKAELHESSLAPRSHWIC